MVSVVSGQEFLVILSVAVIVAVVFALRRRTAGTSSSRGERDGPTGRP